MSINSLVTLPFRGSQEANDAFSDSDPVDRPRVEAALMALLAGEGPSPTASPLLIWVPSPLAGCRMACSLLANARPRRPRSRTWTAWVRTIPEQPPITWDQVVQRAQAILEREPLVPLADTSMFAECGYIRDQGAEELLTIAERCALAASTPAVRARYVDLRPNDHLLHTMAVFGWWRHPHPLFGLLRTVRRACAGLWLLPGVILLGCRPVLVERSGGPWPAADRRLRIVYGDGFGGTLVGNRWQPG